MGFIIGAGVALVACVVWFVLKPAKVAAIEAAVAKDEAAIKSVESKL